MCQDPLALAILGTTASGKSDAAIAIAKKYDGEVISCDSRQVYRGMDIGTGKIARDFPGISNSQFPISNHAFLSEGIPHHLLDVVSPRTEFNAAKFVKKANKALHSILKQNKLPILCGGTGFWAQALIESLDFPGIAPDKALRKKLEKYSLKKLQEMLRKLDPKRYETVDAKNRVRLVRAIEIVQKESDKQTQVTRDKKEHSLSRVTCHMSQKKSHVTCHMSQNESPTTWSIIAISPPQDILEKNIEERLDTRLKQGMFDEVWRLHHENRVPWNRLEGFGLEYRWVSRYLRRKADFDTMRERILIESRQYAKRQRTWLRRWERQGRKIAWVKSREEAIRKARTLLG